MQFITSKQLGDWGGGMGKNTVRTTVKTDIFHPRKTIQVGFLKSMVNLTHKVRR